VITEIKMNNFNDKNLKINRSTNDKLTEKIIGACYKVHNLLGPGFNEKTYQNALKIILKNRSLKFICEKSFAVKLQNEIIGKFRADLIVEDKIIVEIKAIHGFRPKAFEAQVIAYLKATGLQTGLLINFGNNSCQIRRLINGNYSDNKDYGDKSL